MTKTASSSPDYIAIGRDVLNTEARGLSRMAEALGADFDAAVARILAAQGRVICVGVGKSGHVARKIAATLSSTGTAAYFVHPTEASHGDLGMVQASDVVLALSRSGETTELDDIIQYSRRFGVCLIALTAERESTLGRAADIVIELVGAEEACAETNAPTTSTTLSMALGDALAIALLTARGFDAGSFKVFHPGGKLGAMLKTAADLMQTGDAVPLVQEGASLADAIGEMTAKGLGCVAVVRNGALVGLITDGDLRRLLAAGIAQPTVEAAMTRNPFAVEAGLLAGALLQKMNDKKITQVPVLDANRLVGIVHMHDILKAGLI